MARVDAVAAVVLTSYLSRQEQLRLVSAVGVAAQVVPSVVVKRGPAERGSAVEPGRQPDEGDEQQRLQSASQNEQALEALSAAGAAEASRS